MVAYTRLVVLQVNVIVCSNYKRFLIMILYVLLTMSVYVLALCAINYTTGIISS